MTMLVFSTVSDKIVKTLYSNSVTSENKRIHTPSLSQSWGVLLFSIGSSNSGATLHGGDGEEKLYFSLLKSVKRQKAPLGRSVSTHFVADCSFSLVAFSFDSKLFLFSAK